MTRRSNTGNIAHDVYRCSWLCLMMGLAAQLCCSVESRGQPDGLKDLHRRMESLYMSGSSDEQQAVIDSIRDSHTTVPDVRKMAAYYDACLLRMKGNAMEALFIVDSLIADSAGDPDLVRFVGSNERTRALKQLGLFKQARTEVRRALGIAKSNGWLHEEVEMWVLSAEVERRLDNYDTALRHLVQAERMLGGRDYPRGRCNILINRGNVLYYQDRYEEAMEMYRSAERLALSEGFKPLARNAVTNMAGALSMMDSVNAAIALYERALTEQLALEDQRHTADLYGALAMMYDEEGRAADALVAINRAMVIRDMLRDTLSLAGELIVLARIHEHAGRTQQAYDAASRALGLARANGALDPEAGALRIMSRICGQLGRVEESYTLLDDYVKVSEQLQEKACGEATLRTEYAYEAEKKEAKIKLQGEQLGRTAEQNERRRVQRDGILIISGLLMVVLGLLFRNNQHMRRMQEQTQRLHEEEVNHLLKQQEIRALDAMMIGQESERKRVSKDLHDRLGTMLSVIKLQFSGMEGRLKDIEQHHQEKYKLAFGMLDEAVVEVRRISHDMIRGDLSRFGLTSALRDLCQSVEVPGKLKLDLNVFGLEQRLDHKLEIAVYRMVQEAMGNVLKHARAHEVSIQITRTPGALNVIVEDDGIGFDTTLALEGMGMGNLRERAAEFNGTVAIDSRTGRGTSVSVDIPLL